MEAKVPANGRSGLMFGAGLALVLGAGFTTSACNSISGADDISLYSLADDDDGGSAGGGMNGTGGTNNPTSSTDAATNVSASSGSGATSTGASSSSGGPEPCVYPSGPYGVAQGNTVPPSLNWQVYAPNATSPSSLKMEDVFDCDGTKGIDVIIVDTSQYG